MVSTTSPMGFQVVLLPAYEITFWPLLSQSPSPIIILCKVSFSEFSLTSAICFGLFETALFFVVAGNCLLPQLELGQLSSSDGSAPA